MTFASKPKTGGGGGTGTPGTAGAPGSVWRTGAGTPSNATGVDTDQWLNTTTGDVYTRAGGVYSVTGNIRGTAGVSPFLLSGITGGSNNRLLYLNSDGVTAAEVVPTMLDQLNFKQLIWRDNNGAYWLPGALITEPAGANLPADTVRALQQKTSLTGANWRDISPTAAIPADIAATIDKPYVEFGKNVSPTSWRFLEPRADGLAPNPISRFDGLLAANYPRSAAIPTSRWLTNMWTSFDGTTNPAYTTAQTLGTNYPYAAQISFTGQGTFGTRIATDQVTPQAANGQIRALLQKNGANGTIGVGMRLSGTSTTKNGILCKIDDGQGPTTSFQIVDYIGNTSTVLASHPNFTPVHGTFYDMLLECEDTQIRAKAWPAGTTEPADWMLVGYTAQIGAGYFGITANIDTVNVTRVSTVVNNGAKAAAAGVT